MIVVLDTNVVVSALLTPHGPPGRVLDLVFAGALTVACDDRILDEYAAVLRRPKFGFADHDIMEIVDFLAHMGLAVVATPLAVLLPDGDDHEASIMEVFLISPFTGERPPPAAPVVVRSCSARPSRSTNTATR